MSEVKDTTSRAIGRLGVFCCRCVLRKPRVLSLPALHKYLQHPFAHYHISTGSTTVSTTPRRPSASLHCGYFWVQLLEFDGVSIVWIFIPILPCLFTNTFNRVYCRLQYKCINHSTKIVRFPSQRIIMPQTPRRELKKRRVEKTQQTPTSGQTEAQNTLTSGQTEAQNTPTSEQTEAQNTPTAWQPVRSGLPTVCTAKRPRTSTSEDSRTKNPRVTNSTRQAVSGDVQVTATPDVTADSVSNPSITSSAMRQRAVQSPRPNSSVSQRRGHTAPTPSEVLSAVHSTSNGSRSVMHQKSMSLASLLNTVKRLLEQHTLKYQPFLPENELLRVSFEYYPRRCFYLFC